MDLSIIIVNYNTIELTKQTLHSIFDKKYNFIYEVFVVDNASTDGSVDMIKTEFPQVQLIENNQNLGFSKANNLAITLAEGKYILLLNSDTVVLEDCLSKSLSYLDAHPEIGVLGCQVILKNGQLDHACKRGFPTPEASLYYILKLNKLFPNSKRFGQYDLTYLSDQEVNQVDAVTGAFMMVRRGVIDEVGGLDEDFFMYGEDLDWCYRIKKAGWKIIYYPEAKIIHYKGASNKKKKVKIVYEFHRAMYLFYKKHYNEKYNAFVKGLVYMGIGIKLAISTVVNLFKKRGGHDDQGKPKDTK
ncbi:glycosyltransferase family 2 protein [Clostridium formicaceticum]|uniref:Glycosyl transferase family 2 n=1 Tax=Clostridium formicaceticum TaxID=1497 RepID=A0AAC9RI98_9CLOT|nr:glycosyltransferase family 2 protein [Clostridium formicaceticum]AOY75539.1 glycosyl transferase family 2 [Clostridium formicaceticum]ARE85833.1 N-acetylglucosaminyl-diphospho-decaprenol L-rhamnosyltransferase [Clostridium formicaceticum]